MGRGWDMMIAHWDCTFLTVSGARWMSIEWREEAQLAALHSVKALWKFPIEKVVLENPVGRLSSLWRGPTQIVQPWMFGDPESKATCLWIRGLPTLVPRFTAPPVNLKTSVHYESPGIERKKNRSRTFPGLAEAMAAQWGGKLARDEPTLSHDDQKFTSHALSAPSPGVRWISSEVNHA